VDGLKVDANDNVYVAGPCGVYIFNRDGKKLGFIVTGQKTGNVEISSDGYLYITTHDKLVRVKCEHCPRKQ